MAQQEQELDRRNRAAVRYLDRFLNILTLVLGLWLVAAPFVLGYRDSVDGIGGTVNDVIVGIVVVILSVARLFKPLATPPLSLLMAGVGAWQIVAPFALTYAVDGGWPAAKTNDIVVGIALVLFATAAWLIGAWRADPGSGLSHDQATDPGERRRIR
jgi:hypothetical protein